MTTGGGGRREEITTAGEGLEDDRRCRRADAWRVPGTVPIRGFAATSPASRLFAAFEPDPVILVLATTRVRRADWVRAGQALQRVLLTATCNGLAATPISPPVEVPAVRRLLLDRRAGLTVQVVLRVGYGHAAGVTPRRQVSDVLLPQRAASRAGVAGPGRA